MRTHTPGDWQVSKHGTPEHSPQYGIHAGGNDFCIVKGPNAKADAELIAAAPAMLLGLKTAERFEDDLMQRGIKARLSFIRAAIAKAEGAR